MLYNQLILTQSGDNLVRGFMSWLVGFVLGSAMGAALMILFAPFLGDDLKAILKQRYDDAMNEAHLASENKRVELEAQLSRMRAERGLNPKTD
jgi:gas vesicle protein